MADEIRNNSYQKENFQANHQKNTGDKSVLENLVTKAINGDINAFGELYISHVERIYSYVFYSIKNKSATEDITQEVFIRAWRALGSCRGKEKTFSSWLYRIAHNLIVDTIRKKNRRVSLEIQPMETSIDTTKGIEGYLESQELLETINYLPENQRQVIILKFIDGLDNHEIARIMNKSEGAIRILQMRALSNLKKKMDKD